MNQYTTKIWKENPDHVSMIQFEFLNGSSVYYNPDRNEWFGFDKHHEENKSTERVCYRIQAWSNKRSRIHVA